MPGKTKDLKVVAKVPKKARKTMTFDLGDAVKTAVKKEMSKAVENKYSIRLGKVANTVGTPYAAEWITADVLTNAAFCPLLPNVGEGTDGNQRVGKTIVPKYMKVKVHVALGPEVRGSVIRDIRFMFLTNKSVKDTDMLVSTAAGIPNYAQELLWNGGSASPTTYLGCEPYYNQMPINRKQFNVIEDKIVRLAKSSSTDSPTTQFIGAITSQYSADFEVSIPLPSKLLYDGGPSVIYPSNFAPILAYGWCDPMNTISVGTASGYPQDVIVQWTSSLSYEDA